MRLRIVLIIIIVFQTAVLLFFCAEKEGFHEDEGFTLAVNGNTEANDFSVISNEWVSPDSWIHMYSVSEADRFDYQTVYEETVQDAAHPPLYYFALFTIESMLPSAPTKWYGLILNLIFLIGTQIALWFVGRNAFSNKYYAFVPLLLYGLSFGALNTVTFLRMYMMLTFLTVVLILVLCRLMLGKNKYIMTALFAFIGFCGALTHYYFILILVPLAVLYLAWLVFQKQLKMLLITLGAGFATIAIIFKVHPGILWQVTGSHRGAQAFSNLNYRSGNMDNLIEYLEIIRASVLNITSETPILALLICVAVFAVIVVLWSIVFRNKQKAEAPQNPLRWFFISLFLTGCFYTVLIVRIAPYQEDRYLMMLFPVIALLISVLFFNISKRFRLPIFALPVATIVFFIAIGTVSLSSGENYLYKQNDETRAQRENLQTMPVVCAILADAGWERYTLMPELIQNKPEAPVFIMDYPEWESSPDKSAQILEEAKLSSSTGQVMLFVASEHFDAAAVATQLQEVGSFSEQTYFYSIRNWDVYIIS